ncbi:hypothetical protein FACS189490_02310 [Clostridia bacterium]|nr:hypothetical protein FACS189490_02310 [Clostridia bacterium]
MVNHGKVRSTKEPEQLTVDEFSVWEASGVSITEEGEYKYNLVRYLGLE